MSVQSKLKYEIKVYKIWYEDVPEEFYIGSTKYDALYKRMSVHRAHAKKGRKSKIYQTIREKGGDFKYIQIASCIVSCKDEQCAFEQEWIDRLKPTLNSNRAHGLDIEREKQNQREYKQKPEYKQYKKEYRQRPEIKQKRKEDQRRPEYNQRRKERQDSKRRTCVCGAIYIATPYYAQQHYDSEKHRDFISRLPFPFNGGLRTQT
jgi:hypothetical protein